MNELSIDILHQDSDLLVVNKPSGLLSVPGRGPDKQDCVVNRIKALYPGIIDQPAVHRLDMFTSGLMILARNAEAHKYLSKQFELRQVEKQYVALVVGGVDQAKGEIRLAFRLDPDNRPYQVYDPIQGKLGITQWKRLGREGYFTRIAFKPLTGRTHQLRLHAAHPRGLGTPIVGDWLYGTGKEGEPMLLHAFHLKFGHPESGQAMRFESEVPF